MRNAETQPTHVVLAVPAIWRNGGSTGKVIMGTVPMAGAVGTRVTFLMNRMFGNMITLEKRVIGMTTGTKIVEIVEIGVKIGAKNDIEGNIQSEAEVAAEEILGKEIGRGDLGMRMGGVEAQDDIVIVTGMTGEEISYH